MNKYYPIAAVVGRFQVHDLHDAHKYLIDQVANNHKKTIIFLGVPKVVGTKKNPLDFDTRKRMIQHEYPDVVIIALPDVGDDKRWAIELDQRIREIYPIGDVLLYGGRDSFIPYYKKGRGQFDCKELEQNTFVSGTEVRKIVSETVKNSSDFRAGVIYQSYNQYPKVHPCIDSIILNEDSTKILLAKKPKENGWRLIGGFAHPNDESYEFTLIRKIKEDAGLNTKVTDIKYIGSSRVPDWRYRSEEDKIVTILFKCKVSGQIEPSDDVSKLKWFDIHEVSQTWFDLKNEVVGPIVDEHKCLLKIFFENYEN
jgi:bifunctional NMN adenylyltransferase/nudix hydrolase